MDCLKQFSYESNEDCLEITLKVNEVIDADFGLYVWPCSAVLAQYIFHHRNLIVKRRILEIGAGTALPGILAAKLGADVTLSDAVHLTKCLDNCRRTLLLNSLENKVDVLGITWGNIDETLFNLKPIDIILGSDCFYDTKDFEDIIVTVAFLLEQNPSAEFWTTYQERSCDRSIEHLLHKWELVGQEVPLQEFEADSPSLAGSSLPGNHTVRMFIIRRAQ